MKPNRLVFTLLVLLSAAALRLAAQQPPATSTNTPGTNALSNSEGAKEGIAELKARAEKGDAKAQFALGCRYVLLEPGDNIEMSWPEAVRWWRKAAEQNIAAAQNNLSACYRYGMGVEIDEMEAVKWTRKAAEQNDAGGQWMLGKFYETGGCGLRTNNAEAAKWYRKAAEQGHAEAEYKLGKCYDDGTGVAEDGAEAAKWYRKAAEQDHAEAQGALGRLYAYGMKGVPEDSVEAEKWLLKAAKQGQTSSQFHLGGLYATAAKVTRNYAEAAKWFRKAAEGGVVQSQTELGYLYLNGEGVPQDYNEAAKWFRKAAVQGSESAQYRLGEMYAAGDGVMQDFVEVYKWLNLAAASPDWMPPGLRKRLGYPSTGEEGKTARERLAKRMTAAQIAEGQRRSAAFKPRDGDEPIQGDSPSSIADSQPSASGSGFLITEDGFLVTNEHVVKDAGQIRLLTSAGMIAAKVVKVDAANDLALLKAEGRFAALPVVSSRGVRLGGTVATVGFPNIGLQGFAPKLAKGDVAALSGASDDARYFQISVPVQPGNSGGALVDERGNVVGVVSAKLSARAALAASGTLPENVNYAVKSSFLLGFLESVPEVSAKLKEPNTNERKFEDVVKSAEQAAVLVLVY